jgi:transcriptional regulator with XRE-family HTH domain
MDSLGKRIREERKKRGMTLKDLGQLIGFSHSYISQVERGMITPSLLALREIAGALNVPPGDLVNGFDMEKSDNQPNVKLVRHDQRLVLIYPGSSIRNELLLPEYNPNYSYTWLIFPPQSKNSPVGDYRHGSVQTGVVISGRLIFQIENENIVLERGDAITYNAWTEHFWINSDDQKSELVLLTRPAN